MYCSQIDLCSSFLRTMSSDSNNPRLIDFPVDKDEPITEPGNSSEPTSGNPEIGPDKEEGKEPEETDKATVSPSRESEQRIVAEDDDGFKTPTSSDHRIPPITDCPPAPRKTRPQSSKRKASPPPPGARRCLQFESSAEVESIFRPIPDQDCSEDQPKAKKARREDEDSS